MINFLEETLNVLTEHGKNEEDVLWIGRGFDEYSEKKYKTSWNDFRTKANFTYNNGYGIEKIPMDMVIVGSDFWLERHSYDGAEWWEFKSVPKEPPVTKDIVIR